MNDSLVGITGANPCQTHVQDAPADSEALTHGYTTAFLAGAVMLLAAAVVVIVAVNTRRTQGATGAGAMI